MKIKKKISILTIYMHSGGAEKVISLFLKELVKEYDVYLYLFYDKIHYDIPKEVKVISVYRDDKNHFFRRITSSFVVLVKYFKFLKTEKITTSISFLSRPNIVNGIIKNRLPSVKVIMSERIFPSREYGSSSLRMFILKTLIKKYYNRADRFFSNSEFINKDLENNFRVYKDKEVIYNPILIPEKNKGNTQLNYNKKIVSVGRFENAKNHKLIFEAIKKINDVKLTIIGDGSLRKDYEKFILKNNLKDRIFFPGISKRILDELCDYDLFVLSSNYEGFPNVLLEAISVGLPVISTNCPSGPLELLHDGEEIFIEKGYFFKAKYGILINVNDVVALEKAIEFLLDDENEWKKYSQKSLQRAKQYELSVIYQQFKNLIES